MQNNKFLTAAAADSKLRKFREADKKAQTRQSIFAIAAGLALLALIYASNFAVQGRILDQTFHKH